MCRGLELVMEDYVCNVICFYVEWERRWEGGGNEGESIVLI